jgi:hypothetical protein
MSATDQGLARLVGPPAEPARWQRRKPRWITGPVYWPPSWAPMTSARRRKIRRGAERQVFINGHWSDRPELSALELLELLDRVRAPRRPSRTAWSRRSWPVVPYPADGMVAEMVRTPHGAVASMVARERGRSVEARRVRLGKPRRA